MSVILIRNRKGDCPRKETAQGIVAMAVTFTTHVQAGTASVLVVVSSDYRQA
jgi:hypothetical protein